MKTNIYLILILGGILLYGCSSSNQPVLSPNQIVASKKHNKLFIVDETANRISIVDIENSKTLNHINLDDKPRGLALSADESKLFVTQGTEHGYLLEINIEKKQITRSLSVGHTPMAPLITPDGNTLYLSNHFSNNINKINLDSFTIETKANADREPIDLALVKKENILLVANHLPSGHANASYHSAKISEFDAATLELLNEISLPNGSNALKQIEVSKDDRFAYITHILARYNVPTNQIERGWINTNALSIIDIKNSAFLCTIILDDLDRGASNPYGIACSENGEYLYVTHTGTNELSLINLKKLHQRVANIANGNLANHYARTLNEIQNDLSFLQDIRTRIDLQAKGAKAVCSIGTKIFVSMYFSGTIAEINIDELSHVKQIELGKQAEPDQVRLGEIYFNDAKLCKQHWQSCHSCHPGDARVDGLNWDLLNDGIGNPKNTKSLLLSHSTPPAMITGIRSTAELAVRAGIEHILFTHQPNDIADAIDAYLENLRPVPSPYLVNGKLSESAIRGKDVFEKAACSHCHSGPYYTNMKSYDVSEGSGTEEGRKFDTPSLIEIWRTAPYLYDGRAKDLEELFSVYNKQQKHGTTSNLSDQELNDLIEYCLSL